MNADIGGEEWIFFNPERPGVIENILKGIIGILPYAPHQEEKSKDRYCESIHSAQV